LPSPLGRFDQGVQPWSCRHPRFFRFTGGSRILPGRYPLAFATALASFHESQMILFLDYEVEVIVPRGTSTKFVDPVFRIFPFQGFPPPPFFLVYEPPGFCFGGGFPRPRRGALRDRFPLEAFQPRVSSTGLPFPGLPGGGVFLDEPDSRTDSLHPLSRKQTFEEPKFPRSIWRSPHLNFVKVVQQFRPALRLGVPCGTHNYTLLEKVCKHFLQKSLKIFCRYIVSKFSISVYRSFLRINS